MSSTNPPKSSKPPGSSNPPKSSNPPNPPKPPYHAPGWDRTLPGPPPKKGTPSCPTEFGGEWLAREGDAKGSSGEKK
ncbi:hypothetical protein CBER1_10513 [Cercospora berteroae]|uniref:Uncharacterized protein n=1 Tax=Cercospora berteroae TaxID=357750 RepID=A0A2S6BXM6_9PEZI|nr:hypothetical protein CBER1_10513 [Cercospora berteroae]